MKCFLSLDIIYHIVCKSLTTEVVSTEAATHLKSTEKTTTVKTVYAIVKSKFFKKLKGFLRNLKLFFFPKHLSC